MITYIGIEYGSERSNVKFTVTKNEILESALVSKYVCKYMSLDEISRSVFQVSVAKKTLMMAGDWCCIQHRM